MSMKSLCKRALIGIMLWSLALAAVAQVERRPVYLDIHPVAGASPDLLSEGTVAAMAREALSAVGEAVIRLDEQDLPPNVRILRILYIVHEQNHDGRTVIAASASTELLRTWGEDEVRHTYSVYNGIQQSLVQNPDSEAAEADMVRLFKQELQERIAVALAPRERDLLRSDWDSH